MKSTSGVTQQTTSMANRVDTRHTVAELRDWVMVESRDSVSRVNLLISLPEGCESKKDIGREDTLFSRLECIAFEAAKDPFAMQKDLRPRKQIEVAASRE